MKGNERELGGRKNGFVAMLLKATRLDQVQACK